MRIKLFELPTESVDNFVEKWFLVILTNGFYYIFINLNIFCALIYFSYLSKRYCFLHSKNQLIF
jgi:hypothetical protein